MGYAFFNRKANRLASYISPKTTNWVVTESLANIFKAED